MNACRDRAIINVAAFLRSLGVGLMGVVLGIYLSRSGHSAFQIGAVLAFGLAGSACATTLVGIAADRVGRKGFLVLLSILTALGGLSLYALPKFPLLLAMALVSMLNGTGTERSAIFALEQAVIPGLGSDTRRTWNLAFYNVLIDGGGSLGALSAGLPLILQRHSHLPLFRAYQLLFVGYSALYLIVGGLYLLLSPAIEVNAASSLEPAAKINPDTKRIIGETDCAIFIGLFWRRVSDGCAGVLLVLQTVRTIRARSGDCVLCSPSIECSFASWGCMACTPNWAC